MISALQKLSLRDVALFSENSHSSYLALIYLSQARSKHNTHFFFNSLGSER